MSYQFDTTTLRTATKTTNPNVATVRLLARRTVRQNRRAQRAL